LAAAASSPDRSGKGRRAYMAAEDRGAPPGASMSAERWVKDSHGMGRTRSVDEGQNLVSLSRMCPLTGSAGLDASHQP